MIEKSEIENIIRLDLLKVLTTNIFYHYTKYDIAIDNILLNQTLRFSDPRTFNDPFDCNERLLKIEYDKEAVNNTISNFPIALSRQEKRELKRKFSNPKSHVEILENERKKYKIACFSEFHNEILMWSYYADKHSGVCVGFDFPHKYEDRFILCPVKYCEELKPIDGQTDVLRVIIYWLTSKSIRWRHEHEIRAITKCKTSNEHELIQFEAKYVREIIFGCNVSDKKVDEALFKLRKSNFNFERVLVKRMKIDETNFLLKEEIIKPSA